MGGSFAIAAAVWRSACGLAPVGQRVYSPSVAVSHARTSPLLRLVTIAMTSSVACDAPAPDSSQAAAQNEPTANADIGDAPAAADAGDAPVAVAGDAKADGVAPGDDADVAGDRPRVDDLPLQRPDRFGEIRPELPVPAPEALTVHGLAGFEVVAIHARPDLESPRLGYLRFGQRVMVTAAVADEGKDCSKGFHGLPAGGFVCASKGFQVSADAPPYMYMPPPPPKADEPIPYDYGVVAKDGTALWWKMPDAEEVELANERYAAIVEATKPADDADDDASSGDTKSGDTKSGDTKSGDGAKSDDDAGADDDDARRRAREERRRERQERRRERRDGDDDGDAPDDDGADADALPGVDDPAPAPEAPPEPSPEELAAQRKREQEAKRKAEQQAAEERERQVQRMRKASRLPLNSKSPFLESGYVITLGEKVKGEGRSWWRTTRGAFVESRLVYRKGTSDFHGGEIPPGTTRFGFVMEEVASSSVMSPKGKLTWKRKLGHRELVAFTGEVEIAGRTYFVTADGQHVAASILRMAEPATRPKEVRDYERWIDVDLERQILVAYEGDVPVYATLVSTGKKGTEEESFLTPTGKFRITTKHISSSMDGNTASDGSYSIQDVPWAMFFHGNFALHGAFWHSKFGSRRSHGCVNLGPTDAKWLFEWTTPFLPATWHGVSAHAGAPGSMVVVH